MEVEHQYNWGIEADVEIRQKYWGRGGISTDKQVHEDSFQLVHEETQSEVYFQFKSGTIWRPHKIQRETDGGDWECLGFQIHKNLLTFLYVSYYCYSVEND